MPLKELVSTADIEELLELYGGFHDAFIEHMEYVSPYQIDDQLGFFRRENEEANLLVRFSRQYRAPRFIELHFSDLREIYYRPTQEIILECSIQELDGLLYWAESGPFDPTTLSKRGCNWICASRIRWRSLLDGEA